MIFLNSSTTIKQSVGTFIWLSDFYENNALLVETHTQSNYHWIFWMSIVGLRDADESRENFNSFETCKPTIRFHNHN